MVRDGDYMRRLLKPLLRLGGALFAVNWLIGMSRIAVQNTFQCVCPLLDVCAPVGTPQNMLESILNAARSLYSLVADTYAATWFPIVERALGFLILHVPTWLIETTTLAIFTTGAAARASRYSYEMLFERREFLPWRRRIQEAWASGGLRSFALEVLDGVVVALHYPTHRFLTALGNGLVAQLTAPIAERLACHIFDRTLRDAGFREDERPRVNFRRNAARGNPELLALALEVGNLTGDAILDSVLHKQQEMIVKVHTWLVVFMTVLGMVLLFAALGKTCIYFFT
jgi:hypothetical protein